MNQYLKSMGDNEDWPVWKCYLFRMVVMLDQALNTILLGFPDETVSGRLGRALVTKRSKWWVKPSCAILDMAFLALLNESNHCLSSVEHEENFDNRRELWRWFHLKKPKKTNKLKK